MIAIAAPRVFDGERLLSGGVVQVEDDRVVAIDDDIPDDVPVYRLPPESILAPGFVDLQVNGGGGAFVNESVDAATMMAIADAHARHGTTTLLPTLISGTREMIRAALDAATACGMAVHIEGPFISPRRAGIHPPERITELDDDDVARLCAHPGRLLLTLAPETARPEQVARLAAAGVLVFAGHTDATAEQAAAAFDGGVSGCTHLFNAMSQLGSRAPGVVGAALAHGTVRAGIICDGLHVHPAAVRATWRAMGPERLFLVSDAMPTAASDTTSFTLRGETIRLRDGKLASEDGTLAGAHLTMDEAVRRAVRLCGIPLADALRMGTLTPAEVLGRKEVGRIAAGSKADLVALDASLMPIRIWRSGN